MTTDTGGHLVQEAQDQGAVVTGAVEWMPTPIRWHFPKDLPYSFMEFPADVDLSWAAQKYRESVGVLRELLAELEFEEPQQPAQQQAQQQRQQPQQQNRQPAQQQQQRGNNQQQRQGQTRADRFPLVAGWKCDECGGPVGRRAKTGNMQSDAAVCLSKCNDDAGNNRTYVHSVGWLDNEVPAGTQDDLDPDDLPF